MFSVCRRRQHHTHTQEKYPPQRPLSEKRFSLVKENTGRQACLPSCFPSLLIKCNWVGGGTFLCFLMTLTLILEPLCVGIDGVCRLVASVLAHRAKQTKSEDERRRREGGEEKKKEKSCAIVWLVGCQITFLFGKSLVKHCNTCCCSLSFALFLQSPKKRQTKTKTKKPHTHTEQTSDLHLVIQLTTTPQQKLHNTP